MEAKINYALMLLSGNGCKQDLELGRKELINAVNWEKYKCNNEFR